MLDARRHWGDGETKDLRATAMPAEALTSAFEAFNREARSLEAAYVQLEERMRSVTAELRAERSARHRELLAKERLADRLAGLLEMLPGGLLVLDGAGIIREHNARAVELLNRPLAGCPWSDIVRREFRPERHANGELERHDDRRLSLARRPLENEPGEILLLCDVTESRRMSDLLHRARRLSVIGEMTARLAHQIRTPLSSALLYVGALDGRVPAEEARRLTGKLQELSGMVDDMLRFAGGARASGETFAVAPLFCEVIEELAPRRPAGCMLTSEVPAGDLTVRGNRAALKGALANLVENALAACRDPGRVELSALVLDDRVCLTVSDNGPGIPKEMQSRLFEPFFTTRPQGTGLGLAVVRSVAEAHGGHVHFHSSEAGSLFSIALPHPLQRETAGD